MMSTGAMMIRLGEFFFSFALLPITTFKITWSYARVNLVLEPNLTHLIKTLKFRNLNKVFSIFGDDSRPAADRLIALESLEPELLDVTEIGRALLAIKGALLSDQSEEIIRKGALESAGNFAECVAQHFQNFTAPLLVTVAKLSLADEYEIAATECLDKARV